MESGKVEYSGKVPREADDFGFIHSCRIIREWRADDTYPWMHRLTIDYLAPRAAWWASVLVVAAHWWWASSSGCGFNFARGGALLVLISASAYGLLVWYASDVAVVSGSTIKKWHPFHPLFMLPFLGFVGTILWGYGDLLPFGKTC